MDDRIQQHASVLVDHSVRVERGDMVQIVAPSCAEDLVIALHQRLGKIGAHPHLTWLNAQANQAYLQELEPDAVVTAEHARAAMEQTDVHIVIQGHENTAERSDIPAAVEQQLARASTPIQEALPAPRCPHVVSGLRRCTAGRHEHACLRGVRLVGY